MKTLVTYLSIVGLGLFTVPAAAMETYSFTHIVEEGDGPTELADGAIGEAQLFVDVIDVGNNQVLFTFRNTGPEPSIIADIYFDDGTLLGIATLIDVDDGVGGETGVDFSIGAKPRNLPGGKNLLPRFKTSRDFSADADPPPGTGGNGVDPGESLGVVFDLVGGQTFADTIAALGDGSLRIGIHIQGFENGGSEAFVNNGVIPSPNAIVLASIGIGVVGWLRRRRTV